MAKREQGSAFAYAAACAQTRIQPPGSPGYHSVPKGTENKQNTHKDSYIAAHAVATQSVPTELASKRTGPMHTRVPASRYAPLHTHT